MAGKVIVEFFPPLGDKLVKKAAGRLRIEEEIDESDTVRSLLGRMVEKHDGFSFFYDHQEQSVPGYVCLFINDSTLLDKKEMETRLRDGDRISFIPEFVGG